MARRTGPDYARRVTDLAPLLAAARDDDPRVRQEAAMALGARGTDQTVADVVALMVAEPDDFVRETLIWAVVARGRAGVPALVAALDDPTVEHERVLHTLSKIEDPSTVEAILSFADDPDRIVASKAWWALGRIGTPEALPPLMARLGDGDADRRLGLTRALLAYGQPAIAPLTEALDADEPAVREHAAQVLVHLADPDQYAYADRRQGHADRAAEAIRTATAPEVDVVLTALAADDDHPRLAAVAQELREDRA